MRELVLRAAPRPAFARTAQHLDLPLPWHHGRVLLIGDAVRGSVALAAPNDCLGVEDAIVLAHELGEAPTVAEALARFGRRRRPP
jgi:2-polyprenyl-6-methoxyphenol hydroxylase-like FAD-dependent oxidoreductase